MKYILLFLFAGCLSTIAIAQSSVGGNLMINENGVVYVYGEHHFKDGSGFINAGIIETSRTGAKGYLIFAKGSSWTGASGSGYIDGYVQVMHDRSFTFPIGQEKSFRPVAISGGQGTTAAYFKEHPQQRIGKVKNGSPVKRISTEEYWDIQGQQLTNITLSWGKESHIEYLTEGQLNNLTIVGFKNGTWHVIPSKVEEIIPVQLVSPATLKGVASTFANGAITTIDPVIPSDYKVLTLGVVPTKSSEATLGLNGIVNIYPNPVVKDIFIDLEKLEMGEGTILIFHVNGQQVAERTFNNQSKTIQHFNASDYAAGLYELQINFKEGAYTKKFVVGRK